MNDVSIATEVTSIKTVPTQRKKSSESKRTSRFGAQSEVDRRTRRRGKHRVENETNRAKIETKKGSEK